MSTHLWEAKRLNKRTVLKMQRLHELACRVGYSKIKAARFASQFVERQHQGSDRPHLFAVEPNAGFYLNFYEDGLMEDKPKWDKLFRGHILDPVYRKWNITYYTLATIKRAVRNQLKWPDFYLMAWQGGAGVHCNEAIYYRHIDSKEKRGVVDDGGANLETVQARLIAYSQATRSRKVRERLEAVLPIYQAVSQILPSLEYVRAGLLSLNNAVQSRIQDWAHITRGEHLFIRGLGSLDLNHVCQLANSCRREFSIFTPLQFSLLGYAHKLGLLPNPNRRTANTVYYLSGIVQLPERLQHFAQYRDFWSQHEHLDVLATAPVTDFPATPQQILARMDERDEEDYNRGFAEENGGPYLEDSFTFFRQAPPLTLENGWTVKPASTVGELRAAAKRLKNCAASYADVVAAGDTAIVLAYDNEKPVAMGQLSPNYNGYVQLYGPCNQPLPAETNKLMRPTAAHFHKSLFNN